MNVFKLTVVAVGLGLVTACSNNAPGCSDPETLDLVKQIARNAITQKLRLLQQEVAFDLSVRTIRTKSDNTQTGAKTCAADLIATGNGNQTNTPITYTVEITDRGDEFIVNVYGLD